MKHPVVFNDVEYSLPPFEPFSITAENRICKQKKIQLMLCSLAKSILIVQYVGLWVLVREIMVSSYIHLSREEERLLETGLLNQVALN